MNSKTSLTNLFNTNFDNAANKYKNSIFRFVKKYTTTKIKEHFGFEIYTDAYNQGITDVVELLKPYDKNFKNHYDKQVQGGIIHYNIKQSMFILRLSKDTYIFVCSGKIINSIKSYDDLLVSMMNSETDRTSSMVYMYIFGKKSYMWYRKILSMVVTEYKLTNFKVTALKDSDMKIIASELINRSFSTIYLENNVVEKVKEHIDTFIKNKPVYENRNLKFKTGILLQGEPGTGKTSLATAIASEYKSDLVTIDMTSFNELDINDLCGMIDADKSQYIILLEDIDCIIGDRESEDADSESKALVNKLLQLLDSTISPTNCIFVATTNHPEKLDAAIKRNGRFDLIVEIRGINQDKAIEMCKSFNLDNKSINDIISQIKTYPVNQSWLQTQILSKLKDDVVDIMS